MELLKNQAQVFITHIPYRGTGPALTDLLGGQIDVMFLPIHVALQHVRAGNLRALAISSDKPHPLLPDVPPLRDAATSATSTSTCGTACWPPRARRKAAHRAPEPRVEGDPRAARREDRVRDPGHDAGAQQRRRNSAR